MKQALQVLFIIIILSAGINAQERTASAFKAFERTAIPAKVQAFDTLDYADGTGVIFVTNEDGYVAGTNEFGDIGKYQRLDVDGPVIITHVYISIGEYETRPAGSPDNINIVIRSVNSNGSPGPLLGSTQIITTDFDTTVVWTLFELDSTVSHSGPFFVGLEWTGGWDAASSDRFGLVADDVGQGDGAKRAWERWDDNSFKSIHEEWNDGEMDIDLWIGAIYDVVTSVKPDPSVNVSSYTLGQNYPNPFNPTTNIRYGIPFESNVKLTVYNALGEAVSEIVNAVQQPGAYIADFNAAGLSSGLYFYKIEANALDGSGQFREIKKMMLLK